MLKLITLPLLYILLNQTQVIAKDINIDTIVETAKRSGKNTFIFLHTTDCGYCDSMIEFTFDDDKVHALIEKEFIMIDININHKDKVIYKDFHGLARDFAKHIGYNYYPSTVFIDEHKKIIYGQIGLEEEDDFLITLKYINTESYKTMDIELFQENARRKD